MSLENEIESHPKPSEDNVIRALELLSRGEKSIENIGGIRFDKGFIDAVRYGLVSAEEAAGKMRTPWGALALAALCPSIDEGLVLGNIRQDGDALDIYRSDVSPMKSGYISVIDESESIKKARRIFYKVP